MAWHMTAQFRTRLAWAAFGLSGLLIAGSLALVVWHPSGNLIPLVLLFVGALSYSGVGAVILVRQPANRMGWLPVSYTHLRAHETRHDLVCRLLLEKKKNNITIFKIYNHNNQNFITDITIQKLD